MTACATGRLEKLMLKLLLRRMFPLRLRMLVCIAVFALCAGLPCCLLGGAPAPQQVNGAAADGRRVLSDGDRVDVHPPMAGG